MKKALSVFIAIIMLSATVSALAANRAAYTFTGVNIITDGSPNDIQDVKLTKDITVTTSGNMNRKYVGITDLTHNKDAGTFPANDSFKVSGSYLYMAVANANDGSIITLNVPKIDKGSKVTFTFAKPTVTNNGSTLRNTNDPYAYLKIADRYISINGDNFDTWRTESVVTGEETDKIEFYADKWGAVAISKIEVSDGKGIKLHSINVVSNQYANLNVDGIRFCADVTGKITLPSYEEGSSVNITAYKDGYKSREISVTIGKDDAEEEIYLECEKNAVYYESDFGASDGSIDLNGRYYFGDGVKNTGILKLFGRLTFSEGGFLDIDVDSVTISELTYKSDGIYLDAEKVTPKDNMDFELYFDNNNDIEFLVQNGEYTVVPNAYTDFDSIKSLMGGNVNIEYIGISYPDTSNITIDGPDKVSSLSGGMSSYTYTIKPEYALPDAQIEHSVTANASASLHKEADSFKYSLILDALSEGTAEINAEYNGAKATKKVDITSAKISEYELMRNTINSHNPEKLTIISAKDEFGNDINTYGIEMKDFKSSDESVVKTDKNGVLTSVGSGKATITANAYTGIDNIITAEYISDAFYISGVTESDTSYITADITDADEYYVTYEDGESTKISKTQISAATVPSDGTAVTAYYNAENELVSVRNDVVKRGDTIPASNGLKRVFLFSGNEMTEIKDADSTMEGFELNHKAGERFEIAPQYTIKDIGDTSEGKTLDVSLPQGLYTLGFKKSETKRGDIYVNGFMVGNNVDQADADRKVTDGAYYIAEDIYIKDGKLTVSMTDGSTLLDYVTIKKTPYFAERRNRIYVIGDSLACNYYGEFEKEVGGGRTGWGQVIGNYLNVPVTNLANSGQFAKGLYDTAFPSVTANGRAGDICLIECGYNDRNYSTREEMTECVKNMIASCREKGIIPILVTPNASEHDYKQSVAWSSYLRDAAVDTSCDVIDLSKESYDFLHSLYADNADGVITKNYNLTEVGGDTLHSSYAAAQKWASVVAQGLKNLGYEGIINKDYRYTFKDTLGNEITAMVE